MCRRTLCAVRYNNPRIYPEAFLETLEPQVQPETQNPPGEHTSWKRFLLDLLETVGLALILFVVINAISARVRVDGFSMMPTLHDGEFVLVNKLAFHLGSTSRGDIIVFRSTTIPDLDLIKRVIGIAGDRIKIANGTVTVNGVVLNEPYIAAAPDYGGNWVIPAGNLFVLGDNRNDSSDSHAWGFLPVENVIGKATIIYWPPPEWAWINHAQFAVAAP